MLTERPLQSWVEELMGVRVRTARALESRRSSASCDRGSVAAFARGLYIRRNTVRQRLERMSA